MPLDQETLLENLSKAINTCQEIHNDSRTPLDDALALTPLIRDLVEAKRTLRKQSFLATDVKNEYSLAMDALSRINRTVKADLLAHQKTMEFVKNTAEVSATILDLALAVAKLAA